MIRVLCLLLLISGGSATAQARIFFCKNGRVESRLYEKVTEDEGAIVLGLNLRPDVVRQIFLSPPYGKDGNIFGGKASWSRGGDMYRICRKEQACNATQSGRQVATLASRALAAGMRSPAKTCEPEQTIRTASCTPGGELITNQLTGTADQLRAFTGIAVPANAANMILYAPPVSGGDKVWRAQGIAALRQECAAKKPTEILLMRNGLWKIRKTGQEISDCPPQALQMAGGAMALTETERRVTWSTPPHPDNLIPTVRAEGGWHGQGNQWTSHYEQAPQGAGGAVTIRVIIDRSFTRRSPTQIDLDNRLQVLMPPALAQMAGFNGACRFRLKARASWISD